VENSLARSVLQCSGKICDADAEPLKVKQSRVDVKEKSKVDVPKKPLLKLFLQRIDWQGLCCDVAARSVMQMRNIQK
jgi:hypothetical protein